VEKSCTRLAKNTLFFKFISKLKEFWQKKKRTSWEARFKIGQDELSEVTLNLLVGEGMQGYQDSLNLAVSIQIYLESSPYFE
jgi:hypothetical protein